MNGNYHSDSDYSDGDVSDEGHGFDISDCDGEKIRTSQKFS